VEEVLRIRRELALLRAARSQGWCRVHRGLAPDLAGPYQRFRAARHGDSLRAIDEAARRAGSEEERQGLARLRAAVAEERARSVVTRLEEEIAAAEIAAVAEGPEGRLPLRSALRALVLEPQRGRRERLADACARAAAAEEGRRADAIAMQQEALARTGVTAAQLAGFDPAKLAEEAQVALARTGDAFRELLPWALGRWVAEGVQPLPRGDLADHDLGWLESAAFLGGIFPAGALTLTARRLVEAMGFDARRQGVRLDVERREQALVGACVARGEKPGQAAIFLAPLGTPRDWSDLFGALAIALRAVSIAPAAPAEDAWAGDRAQEAAFAALFRGVVRQPLFFRRVLGAGGAAAEEAARGANVLALLELRRLCALALYEREAWSRPPSRSLARTFGELCAEAIGARCDERWYLHGLDLALPASTALRGLALLAAIEPAVLERCDEDWWRNPRTGPWLQGLWARGAAVDVAALVGGAPSLDGYARSLLARL